MSKASFKMLKAGETPVCKFPSIAFPLKKFDSGMIGFPSLPDTKVISHYFSSARQVIEPFVTAYLKTCERLLVNIGPYILKSTDDFPNRFSKYILYNFCCCFLSYPFSFIRSIDRLYASSCRLQKKLVHNFRALAGFDDPKPK